MCAAVTPVLRSVALALVLWGAGPARGANELVEAPLAARSGPPGATLFAAVPAERTGIVVSNDFSDPRMWGDRFQEFKFGAIGTGVAMGDYDNDGRPDLFVVSKTEQSRLFRNLGDWRFEDVTGAAGLGGASGWLDQGTAWVRSWFGAESTAAAWTQGATFADVNNDGWLDLYVCRFAAPNQLYINQGNGTFKEEAEARGLAVVDASGQGAFGDYDRDGWLDVYVQTNLLDAKANPDGQRDYLFRNNGNGTFTNVTDRAGIRGRHQGHAAIWWDYDADGWPDLYIANDFAPADLLYRNNGDGTFTNLLDRVVPRTPHSSMGADLGDVNNDGRIDFFVADMATTTHEKDQRGMARIRSLLTGWAEDGPAAPQLMRNALYLNTGLGRMQEAAFLAGLDATDWTWSVRMEDLDCDGRLDVHVTNGMVRELHNADLVQRISAAESHAEGIRIEKESPVLAERNLAYRNVGELRFEEVGRAWGLDQVGVSFGAAFGDLDGDGDLDLVFANYEAGPTVLRNDAASGGRVVVELRGAKSNRFGVGATVRVKTRAGSQVRQLVTARGYLSSSEPVLHFGLGDAPQVEELSVEWPSGRRQTFRTLASNRRYTITEPNGNPPPHEPETKAPELFAEISTKLGLNVSVAEEATPEREAQSLLPFRFDRQGPMLAVGDVDGDGRPDLVVGGTTVAPLRIGGRGQLPAGNADDGPVVLFDADGDGDLDLLRTKVGAERTANYQPVVYRNDGGSWTATDALPTLAISAGAAVAADFDRDGDLDLFVAGRNQPGRYPLPPASVLLRNDGGKFFDVTDAFAPGLKNVGMVTAAIAADVDGDGGTELVVACEWGEVKVFRNESGRAFSDQTESFGFRAAKTGLWRSLAAGDFNRDGRLDLVAGNLGLNTPYRAPATLFYADFRGGSPPQIIEAHTEGEKLYPRRTKAELGALIPMILRKYPKHDAYAKATLAEIVGAEKLAGARKFEAQELRSGVFLSQPNGTWRFEALPAPAQLAPLQGMVIDDFDGDGQLDIFAAQNSFNQPASVGRFDGGLGVLLRGDGKGNFAAVSPAESGLIVSGDARSVVLADVDGDGVKEIVVSRNREPVLVFGRRQ